MRARAGPSGTTAGGLLYNIEKAEHPLHGVPLEKIASARFGLFLFHEEAMAAEFRSYAEMVARREVCSGGSDRVTGGRPQTKKRGKKQTERKKYNHV